MTESAPRFFTFEGIEASGKTTQIRLLAEALQAAGHEVVVTREPGGSDIGAQIRALLLDPKTETLDPLAELLLFEADRAQHVARVLRPALEAGKIILSDRYCDASIAYQGAARGVDADVVRRLNEIATAGLMPARTFLFDISPDDTVERIKQRMENDGQDQARFDMERIPFHRAVRASYLELAAAEPERWRILDGNRPVDVVQADLREHFQELL